MKKRRACQGFLLLIALSPILSEALPELILNTDVNNNEHLFHSNLPLGDSESFITLLLDTNASVSRIQFSMIMSSECHGGVYDSSTFTNYSEAVSGLQLPNEYGECAGWLGSDYLFLPDYSEFLMDLVLVTHEHFSYQRVPIQGILVPSIQGLGYCNITSPSCNSFVLQLQAAGYISNLTYSVYLSYAGLGHEQVRPPSNVVFGGSRLDVYSSDDEFLYISLVENATGWVVPLEGIWINGVQQPYITNQVRFTTGNFLMLIPENSYMHFINTLLNNTQCGRFPSDYINCPCPDDDKEYTVTFILDENMVEVPSNAFFYKVSLI